MAHKKTQKSTAILFLAEVLSPYEYNATPSPATFLFCSPNSLAIPSDTMLSQPIYIYYVTKYAMWIFDLFLN